MMLKTLREFPKLEAAGGILLVAAALLALVIANSPLGGLYDRLLALPIEIRLGTLEIAKPLLLWVNDGLMVLFFFLVGLELKREFIEGHLSDRARVALPAFGAVGGMLVPSIIYVCINWGDAVALQGWAIPAATDIAFALAIVMLLGDRVPAPLRVLLVTIAVFDDVGAIIIIALFYTDQVSLTAIMVASACLPVLFVLNRSGVANRTPYLLLGALMWAALLKSGVHATLAGVVLALFIPLRSAPGTPSPLRETERQLHGLVSFGVLPAFAFANSGLSLVGTSLAALAHPVSLGIFLGLVVGKQVGVLAFCWLAVRCSLARLPDRVSWRHIYGVALLCGVGFTMSLFIGSLAFGKAGLVLLHDERIGIMAGSLVSGLCGYFYLRTALAGRAPRHGMVEQRRFSRSDAPSAPAAYRR